MLNTIMSIGTEYIIGENELSFEKLTHSQLYAYWQSGYSLPAHIKTLQVPHQNDTRMQQRGPQE
jgi:hypothetical protein